MKRAIVIIVFCAISLNMEAVEKMVSDSIPSPSQFEQQILQQSVDEKSEAVEKLAVALSVLDVKAKAVSDTLRSRKAALLVLENELLSLKSDIGLQESQFADLSEMSEKWARVQLAEALEYIKKNYSQMQSDELNEYLTNVEELSDSASLADIAMIKDARDNLLIYVNVNEELANDCNEDKCKSLIARIEAVVKTVATSEQEEELWDLIYLIEDFATAKERLAETTADIASALAPFRAQESACETDVPEDAIKDVLSREKSRLNLQNYISRIPFTKRKYDELLKQLDSNPFVESAVEIEILQWK